jgi:carbamoyltransferase
LRILGISAFYHDSAACLIEDGKIIAAAQEERFSRVKHDPRFPFNAMSYCLKQGGIESNELDLVVYYDKPLLSFERLMETYLAFAPKGVRSFYKAINTWLSKKLFIKSEIYKGLGAGFQGKILFSRHHLSHAASAFYTSPFEEAAILTADGVGEWATTTIGFGRGKVVTLYKEITFPHSLGLLYSAFTYFLGFRVNSGEYKVMGLAPYGEPRYIDRIFDHLIEPREDGSFRMDMRYFNYCAGLYMTAKRFNDLFDMKPRQPESKLEKKHFDLAASLQKATEIIMLKLARQAKEITKAENLCLAGGVALNCVANGLIKREGIFKNIYIQPASGDAGGALGAAMTAWHMYLGKDRIIRVEDSQKGSYLGPEFSNAEVKSYLDGVGAKYTYYKDDELASEIARLINDGKVVGFFRGRMEFGPRALGARSILGDPRDSEMQTRLNMKIKFRESFRPFAPSVMLDHSAEYFDPGDESPYMLLTEYVRNDKRTDLPEMKAVLTGLELLKIKRSQIPAVTHVDYSARIQTVSKERNGYYCDVLKAFYDLTGCPVLINTSFNIRGEPIVCTPEDAYRCFMFTDMDILVLENYLLKKEDQPSIPGRDEYRQFIGAD